MRGLALAGLIVALGACANEGDAASPAQDGRYAAGHFRADAALVDSAGNGAGTAIAQEDNGNLRVTLEVKGLTPGIHGAHIHAVGKCEGPAFTTAGAHWNPDAKQHGSMNPAGPHHGDLPNLEVAEDGKGKLVFSIPGTKLENLLDEDGAAIVVHASADDLKTDPSGNSGARIACGVFAAK